MGTWCEAKQKRKSKAILEEYGTQPPDSKGKRSDMSELYQMILDDMTECWYITNQDYIMQIDKLDKIRTTVLTEKVWILMLGWIWRSYSGATGTGKTRGVLEENGYSNVYRVTDYVHHLL